MGNMKLQPRRQCHNRSHAGVVAALLVVLCANRNAWAFDESARAEALAHYEKATANYGAQHYCDAAVGFAHAFDVVPLPVSALWSARAHAQCGDLTAAMAKYQVTAQLAPNELWVGVKQQRAQVEATDELELLRKRVPRVVIQVPPLGDEETRVTIDGTALAPEEYGTEYFVNPGAHVVVYTRGSVSLERRIIVAEQQVQVVQFGEGTPENSTVQFVQTKPELEGARSRELARGESVTMKPPANTPVRSERRYQAVTLVSTVIGATGLAAGIITRLLAFDQKTTIDAHCDSTKECDKTGMNAVSKADSLQTQSTLYSLVGLAAVGTGIGFAIAGSAKSTTQAKVAPLVLPAFAGLTLEQRF